MLLLNCLSTPPASRRCHILTLSSLGKDLFERIDVLFVRHNGGVLKGFVKLVELALLGLNDARPSIVIESLFLSLLFQTTRCQQN